MYVLLNSFVRYNVYIDAIGIVQPVKNLLQHSSSHERFSSENLV